MVLPHACTGGRYRYLQLHLPSGWPDYLPHGSRVARRGLRSVARGQAGLVGMRMCAARRFTDQAPRCQLQSREKVFL